MSESNTPFLTLGQHLKYVREQRKQSLAEVSGAVEIEEHLLERIESGKERPAEDILMLLISHLEVQDSEALRLWELGDYEGEAPERIRQDIDQVTNGKQTVMLVALDMRTAYTDGLDIDCNQAGVTLSFTQASGDGAMPVAKVGMSYEQAEIVMKSLETALLHATYLKGPKQLPPTLSSENKHEASN